MTSEVARIQAILTRVVELGLRVESSCRSSEELETQVVPSRLAVRISPERGGLRIALRADFRIAATGTPVENHWGELWSLFRFLNPGLLGPPKTFAERYGSDDLAQVNLKNMIPPFLLRRLKGSVLKELPAKTDITLKVNLSREERLYYESVRLNAVDRMENSQDAGIVGLLAELMRLRRVCCHPQLVDPRSQVPSSKLQRFQEQISDLHEAGHKVLVFSQFVDHLKILQKAVKELGLSYQYLDGSTPAKKRAQAVDAFQAGESDLFLISLKAGGTGLNLQAKRYRFGRRPTTSSPWTRGGTRPPKTKPPTAPTDSASKSPSPSTD